jgi:hypothetical protein
MQMEYYGLLQWNVIQKWKFIYFYFMKTLDRSNIWWLKCIFDTSSLIKTKLLFYWIYGIGNYKLDNIVLSINTVTITLFHLKQSSHRFQLDIYIYIHACLFNSICPLYAWYNLHTLELQFHWFSSPPSLLCWSSVYPKIFVIVLHIKYRHSYLWLFVNSFSPGSLPRTHILLNMYHSRHVRVWLIRF